MAEKHLADQSTYSTMEAALYYLAENHDRPPSLEELAHKSGLSEFHFQKQFSRWVGISPKRFSQFLSKEYIKRLLDEGVRPLDACYQAGLSGPGRMHELFISTEALTPAQYSKMGEGLEIHYGFHDSPFGPYLLAVTERGICHLEFIRGSVEQALDSLRAHWPLSRLVADSKITLPVHAKLFGNPNPPEPRLSVLIKGTNFQIQVWQALLKIPYGSLASYEELAALAGNASAVRASASAVARNHIAWLIPCHRVVRKIGDSGKYRWGKERKQIILAYEAATLRAGD